MFNLAYQEEHYEVLTTIMNEQKLPIDKTQNKIFEASSAALIGIGVIAIIELLGIANLDRALTVSFYSFVISIPMLSVVFLTLVDETKYEYRPRGVPRVYMNIAWLVGALSSLAGIGALIYHFAGCAAILFAFLCVIGLIAWVHYSTELKKANATTPHDQSIKNA